MNPLKDHVAIVTGGASGIGKSIVLSLAEEKARIVIIDILMNQQAKSEEEFHLCPIL
jgi:NAD(P)-dependent dehydrogenase (short-subunit alcohol dehydrogenase family)